MKKSIIIAPMILFLSSVLCGCASGPKKTAEEETALDRQITFYEREAKEYKELGNKGMADYFDKKSNDTRERKYDSDYGPIEFILDLIVESVD